jgi:hypothetical protein
MLRSLGKWSLPCVLVLAGATAARVQNHAQESGSSDMGKAAAQNEQHLRDISKSGKLFLDGCSSVDKPVSQPRSSYETHSNVQCLAYVGGVFETMSLVDNLHLEPHLFCAPQRPVQRIELVQIARKYIASHPETSNERTVALVWLALQQAFPCART